MVESSMDHKFEGNSADLERKKERPVAWGTTGLPFEPAWVWGDRSLWCVGRGFDERPGKPPAGL